MKAKLFVFIACVALGVSACSQGVENTTGRVLENAGGLIRGAKGEVSNNWQKADGSEKRHVVVDPTPTPE